MSRAGCRALRLGRAPTLSRIDEGGVSVPNGAMRLEISTCTLLLFLTACAGHRPPPKQEVPEYRPVRSILLAYDADNDGTVTRAELERGLRAEFAKADA